MKARTRDRWWRLRRHAVVCLALLGLSVAAFAAIAQARVVVRRPPMSICLGQTLRLAVKLDRTTGGSRRYAVVVRSPSNRVVLRRSGDARNTWRSWRYMPSRGGRYRTSYTANGRTQTFATWVLRCDGEGVRVVDNDRGRAMFAARRLGPGDDRASCIIVSYAGAGTANVRLYRTAGAADALSPFLHATVTRGTLPQRVAGSCRGFEADATDYAGHGPGVVFDGRLSAYPSSWEAGILDATAAAVEPWTRGESHAYRIEIELVDDNRAQGLRASATFVWETREA